MLQADAPLCTVPRGPLKHSLIGSILSVPSQGTTFGGPSHLVGKTDAIFASGTGFRACGQKLVRQWLALIAPARARKSGDALRKINAALAAIERTGEC